VNSYILLFIYSYCWSFFFQKKGKKKEFLGQFFESEIKKKMF